MAKLRTLVVAGTVAGGAYWLLKSQDGRRLRERLMGAGPQGTDDLDYADERSEDLRRRIEETRRRLREQVGLPPEG